MSKGTPEILMQPYKPEAITTSRPFKMYFSNDGQKLYVGNIAYSFLYDVGESDNPQYATNHYHYIARPILLRLRMCIPTMSRYSVTRIIPRS